MSDGVCDWSVTLIASILLEVTCSSSHCAVTRVSESSTIGSAVASSKTSVDAIPADLGSSNQCTLAVTSTDDGVFGASVIRDGCTVHSGTSRRTGSGCGGSCRCGGRWPTAVS